MSVRITKTHRDRYQITSTFSWRDLPLVVKDLQDALMIIKEPFYFESPVIRSLDDQITAQCIVTEPFPPVSEVHFQQYLENGETCFLSLRKDTFLYIPRPQNHRTDYGNIQGFCQTASSDEFAQYFSEVPQHLEKALAKFGMVYLSTHGRGAPYLHLRFCGQPKYYVGDYLS